MFEWYWFILFYFGLIHFNFLVWSLYMHRGLVHSQLTFHPVLAHFFRFALWLNFKMWPNWTRFYVAQHRLHHRHSDSLQDIHSPQHLTFKQMFDVAHTDRSRPYHITQEEIEQYAPDVKHPQDWIQQNLYDRYPGLGLFFTYSLVFILFGWKVALIGIPLCWITGQVVGILVVNYLDHKVGFRYRGNKGQDCSTNLVPWGILCCGEELHANHHWDTFNPNYRHFWWEIDMGWVYIRILMFFGLVKLKNH